MFMQCPLEIRQLIYQYAFADHTIHVCDARLKRSVGGPNRPANRRLPGLLHVNKQVYKEARPVLAQQSTLAFNDYLNFALLASAVPKDFARLTRHLSLRGDVVPGQDLDRFPNLEQITYHQLGNCFYVPSSEKGLAKRVSASSSEEVIESVLGRSSALVLIQHALKDRQQHVSLVAKANIMSMHDHTVGAFDLSALVHGLMQGRVSRSTSVHCGSSVRKS